MSWRFVDLVFLREKLAVSTVRPPSCYVFQVRHRLIQRASDNVPSGDPSRSVPVMVSSLFLVLAALTDGAATVVSRVVSIRTTGLAKAYRSRASISPPGLNAGRLRLALSDVGLDVTRDRAMVLLSEHGEGGRLRLRHFNSLIRESRGAEGQVMRFWLTVDHDGTNGLRLSRQGLARFGQAGTLTPTRLAHYTVGGASLLVGTADMVQYIASRGMPDMPIDQAVAHGVLHTAAALLSLPRFSYAYDASRPWRLWMPTVTDAGMWPSFVQSAWYTAAMQSDMVRPSSEALFAMTDPGFLALTHTASFFALYPTLRALEVDLEAPGQRSYTQTASMLMILTFAAYADLSRAIYFSSSVGAHEAYLHFMEQTSPGFSQIQVGMFLGAMYTANLVCALKSATQHKAVTDEQIGIVSFVLNFFVLTALPVYACLYIVADGQFMPAYLDALLWFR